MVLFLPYFFSFLPIELSERSSIVVSGAKKCGTWARLAEVQDTEAVIGEQEHLGKRQVLIFNKALFQVPGQETNHSDI